jgi:hypothetical protein
MKPGTCRPTCAEWSRIGGKPLVIHVIHRKMNLLARGSGGRQVQGGDGGVIACVGLIHSVSTTHVVKSSSLRTSPRGPRDRCPRAGWTSLAPAAPWTLSRRFASSLWASRRSEAYATHSRANGGRYERSWGRLKVRVKTTTSCHFIESIESDPPAGDHTAPDARKNDGRRVPAAALHPLDPNEQTRSTRWHI